MERYAKSMRSDPSLPSKIVLKADRRAQYFIFSVMGSVLFLDLIFVHYKCN